MIVPVGPQGHTQYLEQIDKREGGKYYRKKLMGVLYVPLTSKEEQWPGEECTLLCNGKHMHVHVDQSTSKASLKYIYIYTCCTARLHSKKLC